jgi:uncharacterized protein (TIGR00266 family)
MERVWYLARGQQQVGPMTLEELVAQVGAALPGQRPLVYGPGMNDWMPADEVEAVRVALARAGGARPPPPPSGRPAPGPFGGRIRSDDIDYEIVGVEMQYVEISLDPGETVIAEPGMMMYMTPGVKMETVFGDPSRADGGGGIFDKLMSAGKRMLTGESLFISTFTNTAPSGRHVVAFAAPYPGKIVAMHLDQLGGELICQKDSFVCAARGVQIGIAFQKKIGVGLFGGEGFIMQRLTGNGIAMVHAGGTLMRRTLGVGETLRCDTGCIVAMQPGVQYDIQLVGGLKNTVFGGEGLFFATLTGPGEVWLQSLPFSRLAARMVAGAGSGKEGGSLLGGILQGDRS